MAAEETRIHHHHDLELFQGHDLELFQGHDLELFEGHALPTWHLNPGSKCGFVLAVKQAGWVLVLQSAVGERCHLRPSGWVYLVMHMHQYICHSNLIRVQGSGNRHRKEQWQQRQQKPRKKERKIRIRPMPFQTFLRLHAGKHKHHD